MAKCFYVAVLVDIVSVISSQWQALFCDSRLFRSAVSMKCGHLDIETTTLVTYSIVCCLLVYFTTRGFVAACLLGLLIIRECQILVCRVLACALSYSTIDYITSCVFDDFGASLFDCSLLEHLTTFGGHFVFVVLSVQFAAVGVVTISVFGPSVETSPAGCTQSGEEQFWHRSKNKHVYLHWMKCRPMVWNPWVQGPHCLCSPGERLHKLSMPSKKHVLKLCEMSCVVL